MANNIDFRVKNGLIVATTATVLSSIESTSSQTGALLVSGGVGIGKNLYVGGLTSIAGLTTITNTTNATSTNTGALQVAGGAGIGRDLYVRGTINSLGGPIVLRDVTTSSIILASLQQQTNTVVWEFGRTDISNTPAIDFHTNSGTDFDARIIATTGSTLTNGQARLDLIANQVYLGSTQTATSTQSGALRILGGAGIGQDLYVGGTIYGNIIGTLTGNAATASTVERTNTNAHYLTFVDSNNSSATAESIYTTSSFTIIPSSGNIGIGTTTPTSKLSISDTWNSATNTFTGILLNITDTASTATSLLMDLRIGSNSFFNVDKSGITKFVQLQGRDVLTTNTNGSDITIKGGLGTGNAVGGNVYIRGGNRGPSSSGPTRGNIYIGESSQGNTTYVYQNFVVDWDGPNTNTPFVISRNGSTRLSIFEDVVINNLIEFKGNGSANLAFTSWNNLGIGTTVTNARLTVAGTAQISGITTVTNTTSATSTTTGALLVAGGVGIGGNLYVGGEIVARRLTIELTTITTTLVQTDDVIRTLNTSNATSTTTGALIVSGGAGIGRDLYVGGTIYGTINGTLIGNADTVSTILRSTTTTHYLTFVDSNNSSATAESVYTTSSFTIVPSSGNVGIGTTSPTSKLDIAAGETTTSSISAVNITQTWNSSTVTFTGIKTNITDTTSSSASLLMDLQVNGTSRLRITKNASITGSGDVRYGSAATTHIDSGGNISLNSNSQIASAASFSTGIGLRMFNSLPIIFSSNTISSGDQVYLYTEGGGIFAQRNAGNAQTFRIYNTYTNAVNYERISIGWSNNTARLDIENSGTGVSRNLVISVSTVTISTITNAVSTTTGALVITGGVGIGRDLYVGGNIYGNITGSTGSASQINTIERNIDVSHFLTFVDSNNSSTTAELLYTTSSVVVNPNTSNVGLGTTSPINKLDIVYSSSTTILNFAGGSVTNAGLRIFNSSGTTSTFSYIDLRSGSSDVRLASVQTGSNLSDFVILTDTGNFTLTEQLRIASNSNIGIGLTTPTAKLDVAGGIRISGVTTVTNTTNATSTITGALQVAGGASVGGNLFVHGNVNVGTVNTNSSITVFNTTTSALNLQSTAKFISPNNLNTITVRMLDSDVLTFSGAAGQLFSISDSFTGTIFAVNDISGIPSIEVYDTGLVSLAEFTGNVGIGTTSTSAKLTVNGGVTISGITTVTNTTNATNTSTGALQIRGGVGIARDVWIGGALNVTGGINATVSGTITTATTVSVANDVVSTTTHYLVFASTSSSSPQGTSLKIDASELTFVPSSGNIGIGTVTPISKLHVVGDSRITGITTITNITTATSTATGALQVTGGVGIGGNLYVGGEIVAQRLTIQLTTITTTLVQTDDIIQTYNTSNATSTTTGALQISGGAGIGRDLYVGGTIYGNVNGTVTGAASQINTIERNTNAAHFLTFVDSNNSSTTAELLYTTSSVVVNPSTGNVGIGISSARKFAVFSNISNTEALYVEKNITTGTLSSGVARFIGQTFTGAQTTSNAYIEIIGQNGANSRVVTLGIGVPSTYGSHDAGFLVLGTSAMWNTVNGAWKWSTNNTATNLGITYKGYEWYNNQSDNQNAFTFYHDISSGGNPTFYIYSAKTTNTTTAVFSVGSAQGSNFNIDNLGNVGIGTSSPSTRLDVSGGTRVTGITTVTNTTNATSTITGALQVSGGAGIGRDLYVGGTIYGNISGTLTGNAATVSTIQQTSSSTHYLTFVDSNNASATAESIYTTSTLAVIPSSGNVGIGTTSPNSKLSIINSSNTSGFYLNSNSPSIGATHIAARIIASTGQVNQTTTALAIADGDTAGGGEATFTGVNITANSRNTAIGVDAVITKNWGGAALFGSAIGVRGSGSTDSSLGIAYGGYFIGASNSGTTYGLYVDVTGSGTRIPFAVASNGTERFRITSAGEVGIGTNNPTTLLDVSGGTRITGITTVTNTTQATSTITGALQVSGGAGIGRDLYVGGTIYGNISGTLTGNAATVSVVERNNTNTHFLTFVDSNNISATSESVYTSSSFIIVPSTGNVGIGTTSTLSKLQIGAITDAANTLTLATTLSGIFEVNVNAGGTVYHRLRSNANAGFFDIRAGDTGSGHNVRFFTDNNERLRITSAGNIGINTTTATAILDVNGGTRITGITTVTNVTNSTSTTTGALQISGGVSIGRDLWVGSGVFATTKSFLIDHPTKPGMKLRYGSLEGPENGVYIRGRLTEENVITLPDYWTKLIDQESITVNLTPVGRHQDLYIESIQENKIYIQNGNLLNKKIDCFYTVFAERKDVSKLITEI